MLSVPEIYAVERQVGELSVGAGAARGHGPSLLRRRRVAGRVVYRWVVVARIWFWWIWFTRVSLFGLRGGRELFWPPRLVRPGMVMRRARRGNPAYLWGPGRGRRGRGRVELVWHREGTDRLVLLHEMAHASVHRGSGGRGHGSQWQSEYLRLVRGVLGAGTARALQRRGIAA